MNTERARVRGVQVGDIEHIAENMHELDTLELRYSNPEYSPYEALRISVEESLLCWTATWDEVPAVMFGVCPTEGPGIGRAWLLNDNRKAEYGVSFMKFSREYIEKMQQPFEILFNYIWEGHVESMLWLHWLGFISKGEVPNYNSSGKTFNLMARYKEIC